jgi:CheY-like chemotaxis protein/MinD-like ATPase involved in chromosome partitioning or flagellar assembly
MSEKILIVDDDIDSLKLIGLMLQRHGYEVVAASAGNQAISKAASEDPDLIILDVMMPDMNGYEVCRRLRANAATKSIPIIMFTAKTLIDDKVAGFEAGADDYLTKPTHPAELASRVKAILQRRSHAQPQQEAGAEHGVTIGLIGVKGGVGTTTVALNLAAAYKKLGHAPVIADFRLGSGSLGLYMGQKSAGMANVLSRPPAEIKPNTIELELVSHSTGLRALLSSTRPKESTLDFPIDSALAVVQGMRSIGKPAIFDLGCGYNTLISKLQNEMDELILLIEPANATLSMARELLQELARENDHSHINIVVVNRSQISDQPPWHEVEQALGKEIRAIISAAPDLAFSAVEAATPIVNHHSSAIVASQITKLAEDLIAEVGRWKVAN